MPPFKVEGFIPATFTPFTKEGDVDLDLIDPYQQFLFNKGIRYIYINGSTGEGPSLTIAERKMLCESWMKFCRLPGREMTVFVQVGGCSFKEVEELTRHAVALKVDAISTLPPLYFKPSTVDQLVDFCQRVGQMAPNLPLYYYNIPDRAGVRFDMEAFLVQSRDRIPSLRGIKFSHKDIYEGVRCLRTLDSNGHPFDLLYGCDEQVLSAFAMGFKGAIGSTYNFMPEVYTQMRAALEAGDLQEARRHQYRSVDVVKLLFQYGARPGGPLSSMRSLMSSLFVDMGPPRNPLESLSRDEEKAFLASLRSMGFYDWVKSAK